MARICRVCVDSNREAIDAELASGKSVPQISRETGLPESNLYRHRKDHLSLAKSIIESAPAAAITTIQFLQARDLDLAQVQAMAMLRGHTQAAVGAINQRIRIGLEVANIRGEIAPKPKTVMHVNLDRGAAERIALSYLKHQELSGAIDAKETAPKPQ